MSAGPSTAEQVRKAQVRASALERALTCAFWRAMQQEPMPVMAALEAAARAVGALYAQTAASHGPGGCGCGWRPDPANDLMVLEAMLTSAAEDQVKPDLASTPVAGRA